MKVTLNVLVDDAARRWYVALNAVDAYDHKDALTAAGFRFEACANKTWSVIAYPDTPSDLPKIKAAVDFCHAKGFDITPLGDRAKMILAKLQ
jgi:hypothetical protein